jgi:hypothetical protein
MPAQAQQVAVFPVLVIDWVFLRLAAFCILGTLDLGNKRESGNGGRHNKSRRC